MCIIATKEMGISTIDYAKLKNCFENNNDGAGYAIAPTKNGVIYKKGFFDWKSFSNSLQKDLYGKNLSNIAILCHFRIATHGGISKSNCHPFEVSSKIKDLKRTKGQCGMVAAMNGIIHDIDIKDKSISDTMEYIRTNLSFYRELNSKFYESKNFKNQILKTGAKWSILCSNGNLLNYGNFITEDGWAYSNSSYSYSHSTYSKWNSMFDDYDYDYNSKIKIKNDVTNKDMPKDAFTIIDDKDIVYEVSKHGKEMIPFVGIVFTDEGEYVECGEYDDFYIDRNNNLYEYVYEEKAFYLYSDYVALYTESMTPTNYEFEIEKWESTTCSAYNK